MKQNRLLRFVVVLLVVLGASLSQAAEGRAAAEPTYTALLPPALKLSLQMQVTPGTDGTGRRVRVFSRPASQAKSDILLDAFLNLDAAGQPTYSRLFLGLVPGVGVSLEALRQPTGEFSLRVPEESGTLPFGAPLFSPLVAELFVGRMYNFKKGGPQNFALLLDYGGYPTQLITLKLTAIAGTETITLADGPVKARRLRYEAAIPHLPKEQQTGVFHVGPLGEVLKCDTAFFGVPLLAKGPAFYEEDGRRFKLVFTNPGDTFPVFLYADKRPEGHVVTLETDKGYRIATAACDNKYRLTRLETPWKGRKFTASAVAPQNAVRFKLEAGMPTMIPVTTENRVWFVPHWLATETWESNPATFGNMAVGEKREGTYFPMFTGELVGNPFTVERMPDVAATVAGGADFPVRHYRFSGRNNYEVYTDGKRLIYFTGSDKVTVVRDGWEAFAADIKPPDPPPATPAVANPAK